MFHQRSFEAVPIFYVNEIYIKIIQRCFPMIPCWVFCVASNITNYFSNLLFYVPPNVFKTLEIKTII